MSEQFPTGQPSLPPAEGRRVDQLCDRFEAIWKSGRRPRIELYLWGVSPWLRPVLLRELLAVELECRIRRGEEPAQEEYSQQFPNDAELIAAVFREAAQTPPPAPQHLRS